MTDYSRWIGRSVSLEDEMSLSAARLAAGVFDQDPNAIEVGSNLPCLWHWFYFLPPVAQNELGEDGHPLRNEQSFLPPIPFPRRMFAGASIHCHQPLKLGQAARRESEIKSIESKSGRSGELVFVTVEHRFEQNGQLCLEETQNLVYRQPGEALAAPEVADFEPLPEGTEAKIVTIDSRMLFRYSALTFNAHRIHYDRRYAAQEEGYPGLIVHGQLIATLLVQMAERLAGSEIREFEFRSKAPMFDQSPFRLVARQGDSAVMLEAQRGDGMAAMQAKALVS